MPYDKMWAMIPTARRTAGRGGFTLVELLVVVTIIVLLLSMLSPALSKSIYQAQLASCGATEKAALAGVVSYAMNFNKWYPSHGLEGFGPTGKDPNAPRVFIGPMTIYDSHDAQVRYDMRPSLNGYIPINQGLQCPLTEQIDLEVSPPDSAIEVPYMLMWGWRYYIGDQPDVGMARIGDALEWTEKRGASATVHRYNLLIADMDLAYPEGISSSHPDDRRVLFPAKSENGAAYGLFWWSARWVAIPRNIKRGPLDLNFGFDDGSVQRLSGIGDWNAAPADIPAIDRIPLQYDARRYNPWVHDCFTVPTSH